MRNVPKHLRPGHFEPVVSGSFRPGAFHIPGDAEKSQTRRDVVTFDECAEMTAEDVKRITERIASYASPPCVFLTIEPRAGNELDGAPGPISYEEALKAYREL